MPPLASSKRPTRRRSAPVNEPFSWPNSSLSRSVSGERRAVQRHERPLRSRPALVDRARELTLAGAALAGDEHGGLRAGHLPREPVDLLHRAARAEQPFEAGAVALVDVAAQVLGLEAQLAALDGARDHVGERVEVDRLREVVLRALADRLHRGRDLAERRHDDHREVAVLIVEALEELDAVHLRHAQVGDDDIRRPLRRAGEGGRAVLRERDVVSLLPQQLLEACPGAGLVVDDEDVGFAHVSRIH